MGGLRLNEAMFSHQYDPWYMRVWVWWLTFEVFNDLLFVLIAFTPLGNALGHYWVRPIAFFAMFIPVEGATIVLSILEASRNFLLAFAVIIASTLLTLLGDRVILGMSGNRFVGRRLPRVLCNVLYLFILSITTELFVFAPSAWGTGGLPLSVYLLLGGGLI